MQSNDQVKIEAAKAEMALASRRLRLAMIGLVAAFSVSGTALLLFGGNRRWATGATSGGGFFQVSGLATTAMVAAVLVVAFRVVAHGREPETLFTFARSKRLFAAGVMLLAFALVTIAASACVCWDAWRGANVPEAVPDVQLLVIHIDILFIVSAISSFFLSYTFKYGSYLQWMYDETI